MYSFKRLKPLCVFIEAMHSFFYSFNPPYAGVDWATIRLGTLWAYWFGLNVFYWKRQLKKKADPYVDPSCTLKKGG